MTSIFRTLSTRICWPACAGLIALALLAAAPALSREPSQSLSLEQTQPAGVARPGAAGYALPSAGLVLRLQRTPTEMSLPEGGPSVEIYADGRVVVRRPAPFRDAGVWVGTMERAEIDALVGDLVTSGALETDQAGLERRKADAQRARAEAAEKSSTPRTLFWVSDPDITEVEVVLGSYRKSGELGHAAAPLKASWTWRALHQDAEQLPELDELQALARVQRELITWFDRDDLTRVHELETEVTR